MSASDKAGEQPPCDADKASGVAASFPYQQQLAYSTEKNETMLQLALHAFGPLSIAVNTNAGRHPRPERLVRHSSSSARGS